MKNIYSWIDAQMKQAALLSKEEQDLSVWHYLSQLEPLPAVEKEESAQRGLTSLVEQDERTVLLDLDEGDFGLDLASYLDDDDFGLDQASYLDDEGIGLDHRDYLDEEDFGLDQGEYLEDEDLEEDSPSKHEEQSSNLVDAENESGGKPQIFIRKYIAASAEPSTVEEEVLADLTGELKMRALVHVIGKKQLQIQFLSSYINPHWENTFPAPFSLMDWLNEFTGDIDVNYHHTFTIHLDSGPVTEESFLAFMKLRSGRVKIGVPLKALFYYTWRFNFDEKAQTPGNEKRVIYLIGERLERQEFNQLMEPERKQVILIGTDQETLVRQKERLSTLPSESHVHFFSSLSFYDLYLYMNVNEGAEKENVDGADKRKIDFPVFLRMQLNNWAEQGQNEEKLNHLISEVIHEMCNEWWLEHSPEDILLMKKIIKVSACFQTNVIPTVKRIYKLNKRMLAYFKNQDYDTKQAFFLQIEKALTPICQLLNEGVGVSK
ncbi:hypothetical protein ACTQ5K_08915 [Niallia sp. Sow4_A1]|uniref:hypothetical protein n=1 Tax=unclassified Niallia TaxID=2837522 RepID=UPI00204251BE|nr:hypothetical protein [Niallia sp. MER TA 168]MCM3364725.1 hypothetical protein [Niallia sp. MER TA 168]